MSSSEGSPFSFNRLEALPSAPASLGCLFLGLATPTLVLLPALSPTSGQERVEVKREVRKFIYIRGERLPMKERA